MQFRTIAVSVIFCWVLFATACNRSAQSYIVKGNEFFQVGKYEDAALNYRKAIQSDPKSGEAFYRLGLVEIERTNARGAYSSLTRAVELLPDHQDAKSKLADLCVTTYLQDQTRPKFLYDKVAELAQYFLKQNPKSFDGLRLKGYIAIMDRKPKDAEDLFRRAADVKPWDPTVTTALAEIMFSEAQHGEGEKLALELIRRHKTHQPIYDVLYRYYLAANRPQDGENILKAKAAANPKDSTPILQLARHYAAFHKASEVSATLQLLLNNTKDFPDAYLKVGEFYTGGGNAQEAIRQYERGASTASGAQKLVYLKRISNLLVTQGKNAEAIKVNEEILKQYPDDTESRSVRALLVAESGKPEAVDSAIRELQLLVSKRQEDPILHYKLGRLLFRKGSLEAAKTQFQEAVQKNPNYLEPQYALAELGLRTNPMDTVHYTEQILTIDRGNLKARLLHAMGLSGVGNHEAARLELIQMIKDVPNFVDAQLQLGLVYIGQKKFTEAMAIFHKFYKPGQPDPRPLTGLVGARIGQHQIESALQLLNNELKSVPDSIPVRLTLASTALQAEKPSIAVEQYQYLLKGYPNNSDLHSQLAHVYKRTGDLENAIKSFEKAFQLAPKNGALANLLGQVLESSGRDQDAITYYRRSLALHPGNSSALNNLAYLLADTNGDLGEALRLAQRARLKSDPPEIADTIGWIYYKQNQTDAALQIFDNLVQKYPTNPTFRFHRGATLIRKGNREAGRVELQTALTNKPSPKEQAMIKQLLGTGQ